MSDINIEREMGFADFSERITILTAKEIEEIYGLPTSSDEERGLYFAMDTKEIRIAFRQP